MSGQVTPLGVSLLTVIACALCLAVLTGRAELFVAALPIALVVAAQARRGPAPRAQVARAVSRDRVFEGDAVTVLVEVSTESPLALIEVLGSRPGGTAVAAGRDRAVMSLGAGETGRFSYELVFSGRGVHDLGAIPVRVRDRFGVYTWERRYAEPTWVRVYPRIESLRSLPRPAHARASVGDHVSPALGEGIEPGDIREFAPGDRIRQVNWRASLRLGTLYVTQHHRERNADVVLMLDTLAETGASPGTTLDWAVRAAASLAAEYLARKDRVGLVSYGGVMHWVKPGTGRVQYERIADALARAAVVFTYVAKDLALVPPRVLPAQAHVIAITPLLDSRFAHAVLDLASRGFDVLVLVISPVEVTRAILPPSRLNALTCRLWDLERREQLAELRRHGFPVLEWRPPQPLEAALAASRRWRPRLASVG